MGVIVIHGLGYAGLTAAVHFANSGLGVIGYDIDQSVVDAINAGTPKAGDFLAYLSTDVAALVRNGALRATSKFDDVAHHHVHLIDVPTERDGAPDTTLIKGVIERLAARVPKNALIIVESTVTPGTTDELLAEKGAFHDRVLGARDLDYAICPRRDWFADPNKNLGTIPRIVGGYDSGSGARAWSLLLNVTPTAYLLRTDYRTAEVTKALENALLQVPVMFAYQLAAALPDFNIAEALRLACTHWRFVSLGGLHLGMGVGGRCVPLGTQYLVNAANKRLAPGLEIGQAAITENEVFPHRIAHIVTHGMRTSDDRTLVLGVGYRPEFKDAGSSPGLAVARALATRNALVSIHDHLFSVEELCKLVAGEQMTILHDEGLERRLHEYDFVLLATPHQRYATLPETAAWTPGQIVLDGNGAWAAHRDRFKALRVRYVRVGEPGWDKLKTV